MVGVGCDWMSGDWIDPKTSGSGYCVCHCGCGHTVTDDVKHVTHGFEKAHPVPTKTPTLGCGWGFLRVQVQVALENPRVACDNP